MGFGSVFLLSEGKGSEDVNSTTATPPAAATQQPGLNVAELIIARGFGTVIRHRDFEERSNHYENLLAAETRATSGRKGIHSAKDPPSMHVTDLLAVRILNSIYLFMISVFLCVSYSFYCGLFSGLSQESQRFPPISAAQQEDDCCC